eukprot:381448_1
MNSWKCTAICVVYLCISIAATPVKVKQRRRADQHDSGNSQSMPMVPIGSGMSLRITWLGITCALGGNPCDFGNKILYRTHANGQWHQFYPQIPILVYRYGKDCEFIIRDLPRNAKFVRIQLTD